MTIAERIGAALSPRSLSLILFPTEKCNFRCVYCYEDFKQGNMRPSLVNGVKKLIESRVDDLDELEINWFGGEPLLAHSIVLDVCSHASGLAKSRVNLRFLSSMTTNGYFLTPDLLPSLLGAGVRNFQISLDGTPEVHDATRVTISGGGTFAQIWSNLVYMQTLSEEFYVTLRLHYTRSNWKAILPLVDMINERFSEDDRFGIFFKSIVRLGGAEDDKIEIIPREENDAIKEELNSRVKGDRLKHKYLSGTPEDYICYASMANSLVIRANGDINKCTVALSNPRNKIGRLNDNGTLTIDSDKMRPWLTGLVTHNPKALACPYGQMMAGKL